MCCTGQKSVACLCKSILFPTDTGPRKNACTCVVGQRSLCILNPCPSSARYSETGLFPLEKGKEKKKEKKKKERYPILKFCLLSCCSFISDAVFFSSVCFVCWCLCSFSLWWCLILFSSSSAFFPVCTLCLVCEVNFH